MENRKGKCQRKQAQTLTLDGKSPMENTQNKIHSRKRQRGNLERKIPKEQYSRKNPQWQNFQYTI